MKSTRALVMAVFATSVLAVGGVAARADTSATTPRREAGPGAVGRGHASSIVAWVERDAETAGRSTAAAARYVSDGVFSAGEAVGHETVKALEAVASFGQRLADRAASAF